MQYTVIGAEAASLPIRTTGPISCSRPATGYPHCRQPFLILNGRVFAELPAIPSLPRDPRFATSHRSRARSMPTARINKMAEYIAQHTTARVAGNGSTPPDVPCAPIPAPPRRDHRQTSRWWRATIIAEFDQADGRDGCGSPKAGGHGFEVNEAAIGGPRAARRRAFPRGCLARIGVTMMTQIDKMIGARRGAPVGRFELGQACYLDKQRRPLTA